MTISELEQQINASAMVSHDEIFVDQCMLLDLIADWRMMRDALTSVLSVDPPSRGSEHEIIRRALKLIKVES